MTADAALNEEEQKAWDAMKTGDGAKPAEKVEAKPEEKPAEKAEAKAEEKPKTEEKKELPVVPKAALDQARIENKELRKELDAMKAQVSDGDKKLRELLDKIEKKADGPPKFEDDPAGNLKHENAELRKSLDEVRAKLEKQDQAAAQSGKISEFKATVDAKEAAFAKEHPDYWDAAKFLQEAWKDELAESGFDEAEIPKMVIAKALGITGKAHQAGKDPAQTIYNLAKRFGFQAPKAEAKEEKKGDEKKGKAESKLEQIDKGQKLAKTNGGAAGPEESTLASLAQMDNDQLDKIVADPDWWNKNIRRSPLH